MEAYRSSVVNFCSIKVSNENIKPELAKYRGDDKAGGDGVEGNEVGGGGAVAIVAEDASKAYNDEESAQ